MDPTFLGPVTGSLAVSIEALIGTPFEPAIHPIYEVMIFFGELGL